MRISALFRHIERDTQEGLKDSARAIYGLDAASGKFRIVVSMLYAPF